MYVNIKPDKKTLHTFCFEGTPRTKINARGCTVECVGRVIQKKKKKLFII